MSLNKKTVIAIIQARSGSTRYPGKVLKKLHGRPSLYYVIERVKRSKYIDKIILATTKNECDNSIEKVGITSAVEVFRGSEHDVLKRFVDCLKKQNIKYDIVSRVNADNFLICPEVIDQAIHKLIDSNLAVVNPFMENTFPFGSGAETAYSDILYKIESLTRNEIKLYREHIFFYCYDHKDEFKVSPLQAPENLNYPAINLSVDTEDDFRHLKLFFESHTADECISAGVREIINFYNGLS